MTTGPPATAPVATRPYDGHLRRERAEETRERILAAGSELLHGESVRDWRTLTVRAVARRAGVNERTVYRHFGNERGLRDAVMHRHEEDAGIDLHAMELGDVATVTAQIFGHVSSYPRVLRAPLDPTLVDANLRQKEALLRVVASGAPEWEPDEVQVAAALLDVLWSVATYERLTGDWQVDLDAAVDGATWVIGLVTEAIEQGRAPVGGTGGRARGHRGP